VRGFLLHGLAEFFIDVKTEMSSGRAQPCKALRQTAAGADCWWVPLQGDTFSLSLKGKAHLTYGLAKRPASPMSTALRLPRTRRVDSPQEPSIDCST
jgi:hypothetical protein